MNYASGNDGAKSGNFYIITLFLCSTIFLQLSVKQQTGPENGSGKPVQFVAR